MKTTLKKVGAPSLVGKITMIFSNTDKKIKLFSIFGLIIYLQTNYP